MAVLRRATTGDMDAIVTLVDPAGADRDDLVRDLVSHEASLVAVDNDAVVGFIGVRPHHFYGRDFIDLLFVDVSFRRSGIGRLLMRAAVENASTSRVFTSTNESNGPMQQLLSAEGWSPSGRLVGLDEGDPELVYFHDVEGR